MKKVISLLLGLVMIFSIPSFLSGSNFGNNASWQGNGKADRLIAILDDESRSLKDCLEIVTDAEFEARRELLNQLPRLKDQEIGKAVCLHYLRNDASADIRTAAASAMSRWPLDQKLVDALISCVEKDDSAVARVFACQSLGYSEILAGTNMTRAYKTLLRVVETQDAHKNWSVSQGAIRALGKMKYEPARDRIIRFFNDNPGNHNVAWHCAEALASIGGADKIVFQAADAALKNDNRNIRHFAIKAVSSVSQPKDVPFFINHLADELKRTVFDWRNNGVSNHRVFKGMITCLHKITDQRFGEDVNSWVKWYNANKNDHPEWTWSPEAMGVSKDLLEEYRRSLIKENTKR